VTVTRLTDDQWQKIKGVLPQKPVNNLGGRPPVDDRKCFEGILWILLKRSAWSALPECYGSRSSVHRKFREWNSTGVWLRMFYRFLEGLSSDESAFWIEVLKKSRVPRPRRLPLRIEADPSDTYANK
jgi:putative transposase